MVSTISLHCSFTPNPPKEGVGLASRGGKKVLLCFWDNGFVAKKRPRKRSTR